MLDDLRNSSSFQDEEPQPEPQKPVVADALAAKPKAPFLGMTAAQRFILAVALFMMVCMVGMLLLVLFEKVVLPF